MTENSHEINLRFVYGMRCLGKGYAGGRTLCAILNTPAPPSKFHKIMQPTVQSLEAVAENSMKEAGEEAALENNSREIAVAVDGSWQKEVTPRSMVLCKCRQWESSRCSVLDQVLYGMQER